VLTSFAEGYVTPVNCFMTNTFEHPVSSTSGDGVVNNSIWSKSMLYDPLRDPLCDAILGPVMVNG